MRQVYGKCFKFINILDFKCRFWSCVLTLKRLSTRKKWMKSEHENDIDGEDEFEANNKVGSKIEDGENANDLVVQHVMQTWEGGRGRGHWLGFIHGGDSDSHTHLIPLLKSNPPKRKESCKHPRRTSIGTLRSRFKPESQTDDGGGGGGS
ncbi:hypothetical protein PIB30_070020 [Stylosanthes scabra]|uniref:Uncharacterized protein n=1 Tax=Stylosanthes scabra TaxID=79078 RepID=A0ABU6VLS6_9FABA|nr:hypothetical protein [Stylosanthes scabra]